MVRNYKRKTSRGETPRDLIEDGVNEIIFAGRSIRSVASKIGMCPMTLCRYVKQAQAVGSRDLQIGYRSPQRVFSNEQDMILQEYIIRAANIYFGLSPKDVRGPAYECALEFGINMPDQWIRDKDAGPDWFSGFLKRNPSLPIRTPEATSLSRATSFNRANVDRFFRQLETVVERDCIRPYDIWNVDETGITTVQKPTSVVGPKGVKQIGALTSGERGSLVTMCAAVSATGNSVPPMFIFPRVKFYDHFIRDGPEGCIGASHPSGWMTSDNFYIFIQHFAKIAKPTPEKRVLLLLDNHHSHIGLDTIKFAKENGIAMLSFPPHCSHKLQPLDRSVFGPLKKSVSALQDTWMRNNPAKTMSIYDLPGIVRDAWLRAATQTNIINGFKVSGIHPLYSCVFQDIDFAPAYVTDRPDPSKMSTNGNGDFSSAGSGNDSTDPASCPRTEELQPTETNHMRAGETDQSIDLDTPFATVNAQLRDINREVATVPGDGHCLLHAVAVGLAEEGIEVSTTESLCTMLLTEVTEYTDYYRQFSSDRNVIDDIDRYVRFKEYNNDSADLTLSALCNCLGISAIIYRHTPADLINILATGPGRPNIGFRGDIYLVLTGDGGNVRYSGVKKINIPLTQTVTGSLNDTPDTVFTPERVRPFPKAPPRENTGRRKKQTSAVLTDTPEKNAIENEHRLKQNRSKKGTLTKKIAKISVSSTMHKKKEPKKNTKRSKVNSDVVLQMKKNGFV